MTLFLIYATAHRNYPAFRILHPLCFLCGSSPLVVFCAFNCCIHFCFVFIVLFLHFSVCVVLCLLVHRVFFACQFSQNYPCHVFRGGAFLYSGFTFSHYELPFPTRYCIPYVRSGLYQLIICVKGIRVCALHCVRAVTSIRIAFEVLSFFSAWTPRCQESSFVSLAHGPRWLFLLSRHRKSYFCCC